MKIERIPYDPPDPWTQFFADFADLASLTDKQLSIAMTQLAREAGEEPMTALRRIDEESK